MIVGEKSTRGIEHALARCTRVCHDGTPLLSSSGQPPASSSLEKQRFRIFHHLLDLDQKAYGLTPIDNPMVIGHRYIHHWANHNLSVESYRTLFDLMHPQNANLWAI